MSARKKRWLGDSGYEHKLFLPPSQLDTHKDDAVVEAHLATCSWRLFYISNASFLDNDALDIVEYTL